MAHEYDLGRTYARMEVLSGRKLIRDPRLEAIASDRAVEAYYTVGTTGSMGIPHPLQQLAGRVFPLNSSVESPESGVWENALWFYYVQPDPYVHAAEAWWASPEHHENMMNPKAVAYGVGVYKVNVPGENPRWYFICEFSEAMVPNEEIQNVSFAAGLHYGYRFDVDGKIVGTKAYTLSRSSQAGMDTRIDIPGRGRFVRITGGIWAGYFVQESRLTVEPRGRLY